MHNSYYRSPFWEHHAKTFLKGDLVELEQEVYIVIEYPTSEKFVGKRNFYTKKKNRLEEINFSHKIVCLLAEREIVGAFADDCKLIRRNV